MYDSLAKRQRGGDPSAAVHALIVQHITDRTLSVTMADLVTSTFVDASEAGYVYGLAASFRSGESRRGDCDDHAVMESFFSTVKSELGERFDSNGEAKIKLFDYIEAFYNQRRRHSTLGQISPAAFERRTREKGVDAVENCTDRSFPPRPHPSPVSQREEEPTKSDQLNETVH